MSYISINPATEEVLAEFELHSDAYIEEALATSARAFAHWRTTSFDKRAELMKEASNVLEQESDEVAMLLTSEMGKTLTAAKAEVAKCVSTMRYFAQHAESLLSEEVIPSSARYSGIRYEPLGTVLAVMPWNYALWQAIRFLAPGLMAGNCAVLKHARNVPRAASYLESLFLRAGFPAGVFTNLFIDHAQLADVIGDDRIAAVTLTGSEGAGTAIGGMAGSHLKKCVLELGGSDAFVIASSADMARTIPMAVTGRIQNNGQSCIAAKRFIVVEERAEEFIDGFVTAMGAVTMGDPTDPANTLGPLVNAQQRDLLHAQVENSVAAGATLRVGGFIPDHKGYYYPATVLTDVPRSSRAGCEELFGPVAVVIVVSNLEEAISVANSTPWGLGSSVWATDQREIDTATAGLEAGLVFANSIVASMPELPFGGIKRSGYGRELSALGIREFTNAKTFYMA